MLKKCKYLLLLIVGLFGFISFSNAVNYNAFEDYSDYLYFSTGSLSESYTIDFGSQNDLLVCLHWENSTTPWSYQRVNIKNQWGNCQTQSVVLDSINNNACFYTCKRTTSTNELILGTQNPTSISDMKVYVFTGYTKLPQLGSSQECETCPTTGEILSGYCDTNYCVENDLCPTSTGSWSELVINDIVHEGKPLINLMIPDYIQWDYTGDENQYDIYVGTGYDQDYIDSILKINSYRPDTKDFTQIFVSGLTLIFPYIFVALLIVFIWKLLKRVFK